MMEITWEETPEGQREGRRKEEKQVEGGGFDSILLYKQQPKGKGELHPDKSLARMKRNKKYIKNPLLVI